MSATLERLERFVAAGRTLDTTDKAIARALLKELREPDAEMVIAGERAIARAIDPELIFRAMIDAILAEPHA